MKEIQKYIRVNIVDAAPMRFGDFKTTYPTSGGANQQRPDDDPGYVIFYRKGQPNEYVSWCPAKEFDAVSTPFHKDGMSYGMAIDACRYAGKKIQRVNWNGEGQYVEFRHVATLLEDEPDAIIDEGNERDCFAFVFNFVNRKTGETGLQVGWLASQADMAASDWRIVE